MPGLIDSNSNSARLATVWRGTAPEAVVRGHVAIVDSRGSLLAGVGDPNSLTTLRSAVKPLQALGFAEVYQQLGCDQDELAIGCASHEAAPDQLAVVARLLEHLGLDESALSCGAQRPYDQMSAAQQLVAGTPLRRIDNNCSGKHAAMLGACIGHNWPVAGYADPAHPLQQRINADFARLSGCDMTSAPWGIDGCGLPTYALPLSGLARAFAAGNQDPLFQRCQGAMAAYPQLIAGPGRFDTVLMSLLPERITCKGGAYAVWAATLRPDGPGIAIKLEAGWAEHMALIACTVLMRLGALPTQLPSELAALAGGKVRNRAGIVVGEVRPELGSNGLGSIP